MPLLEIALKKKRRKREKKNVLLGVLYLSIFSIYHGLNDGPPAWRSLVYKDLVTCSSFSPFAWPFRILEYWVMEAYGGEKWIKRSVIRIIFLLFYAPYLSDVQREVPQVTPLTQEKHGWAMWIDAILLKKNRIIF